MWWLYFNYVARVAERRLELAPDRTRLARDGYTYMHVLLVAGVILAAVGDELVIAHPTDVLPAEELAAVAGGPALYLFAHVLFRLRMAGSLSVKRLGGGLACIARGVLGAFMPALAVAALLVAILVAVIAAEERSGARRRHAASRRRSNGSRRRRPSAPRRPARSRALPSRSGCLRSSRSGSPSRTPAAPGSAATTGRGSWRAAPGPCS